MGVALCIIGILLNVWQDYHDDQEQPSPITTDSHQTFLLNHKFFGDLLALLGAFLFGTSDVLGEVVVRNLGGPLEYLGMMGFFGAIICTVQSFCFERDAIISLYYANELCSTFWLLLFAFVFFSTLSYALTARFFQVSEAALFHLSMQTEGLWSVGFSVWADHIMPGPLFFVSLMAAVAGVCVYEMAPSPVQEDREEKKKMAE